MGVTERMKKWKRVVDNCMTYRRVVFLTIAIIFVVFYIYPNYVTRNRKSHSLKLEKIRECIEERLIPFFPEIEEGNVNVRHIPSDELENSFLPFVGNGYFGVTITPDSFIYLKTLRTLSLKVLWSPLYNVITDMAMKEAVVSNFFGGTVQRYQCLGNGLHITHQYVAHRLRPYLFLQELKIVNPSMNKITVQLKSINRGLWPTAQSRILRLPKSKSKTTYEIITGTVDTKNENEDSVVSILVKTIPQILEMEPFRSRTIQIPFVIYSESVKKGTMFNHKEAIERRCIEEMVNVTSVEFNKLKQDHVNAWAKVWQTGLSISHSKAAQALNGDRINATIYYVLSNVLPYDHILFNKTGALKNDNNNYLTSAEGCYGGYHHTLQAKNLWKYLSTFEEVTEIVNLWLLTLEKQGCQKLINSGYSGVMQALVLSFGGFRFSGHHLEFKIDPKFLHRDYVFRRISYDGSTSINVTVTLQDDNKAILGVSLDKSDKTYYACDGGCIEEPVKLGTSVIYFPVKMTEPITSILYITSDKNHMELIKDTLHVHKIVEAPAYDHHVIALHRHGHHLGGLPVLFWASICFLIIIFHLFLFKLIFNEYCDKQDKHRIRYGKI